jgi:hypothetical protein
MNVSSCYDKIWHNDNICQKNDFYHLEICTHDSFEFIIISFNLSIWKTWNVVRLYKAPIKCD